LVATGCSKSAGVQNGYDRFIPYAAGQWKLR